MTSHSCPTHRFLLMIPVNLSRVIAQISYRTIIDHFFFVIFLPIKFFDRSTPMKYSSRHFSPIFFTSMFQFDLPNISIVNSNSLICMILEYIEYINRSSVSISEKKNQTPPPITINP